MFDEEPEGIKLDGNTSDDNVYPLQYSIPSDV